MALATKFLAWPACLKGNHFFQNSASPGCSQNHTSLLFYCLMPDDFARQVRRERVNLDQNDVQPHRTPFWTLFIMALFKATCCTGNNIPNSNLTETLEIQDKHKPRKRYSTTWPVSFLQYMLLAILGWYWHKILYELANILYPFSRKHLFTQLCI